jgi:hypothetical protein
MPEVAKGLVESKSRKGNGIKLDGNWYTTFKSSDLDHVNWKDTVEFLWDYDKTSTYRNIKGTVKVTSAGSTAPSGASKGAGYNPIGVEVGHAWNSALKVVFARGKSEVGSDEFYKEVIEHTEKIYRINKSLKTNLASDVVLEAFTDTKKIPSPTTEAPKDLF